MCCIRSVQIKYKKLHEILSLTDIGKKLVIFSVKAIFATLVLLLMAVKLKFIICTSFICAVLFTVIAFQSDLFHFYSQKA
jgi:hypothetical protein